MVAMIWGGSFAAIKHLLEVFSPSELLVARFFPAFFIFLLIILTFYRREALLMLKKDTLKVIFVALIGTPGYHFALNYGETQISAGLASLIIGLNPSITFIFSLIMLKEKPKIVRLLGILVSFTGLFILVRYGSGQALTYNYIGAVFVTILSPACWAIYTVTSKPLAMKYPPLAFAALTTAIGILPCFVLIDGILIEKIFTLKLEYFISIGFLSLLATIVGVVVWMISIRKIAPTKVASFVYLVPVFAVTFGIIFLNEPLNVQRVVGAVLILGGVYVTNKRYR